MIDSSSPCGGSPTKTPRPNPGSHAGSLVYWLEVPSDRQHYIHGILEGYDDLGYYQTMVHDYGTTPGGQSLALARITSTEDAREKLTALIGVFEDEYEVRMLESAPDIPPDAQPRSRKHSSSSSEGS